MSQPTCVLYSLMGNTTGAQPVFDDRPLLPSSFVIFILTSSPSPPHPFLLDFSLFFLLPSAPLGFFKCGRRLLTWLPTLSAPDTHSLV